MALSKSQIKSVEKIIKSSLIKRFETYNPEPAVMPFHTILLGKDRLALYSFIHSLNTNFGTTIFETVAVSLASNRFKVAKSQVKSGTQISEKAQYEIQKIMDNLTSANNKPDKSKETKVIRKFCQSGKIRTIKPTKVDVYLESNEVEIYLIDIKTAKPNKGSFREFKRTLLEWSATVLAEIPKAKINTLIAIPYNPYEPKPYSRWTMAGMLDLEKELKVGIEMRNKIDNYFKKFK